MDDPSFWHLSSVLSAPVALSQNSLIPCVSVVLAGHRKRLSSGSLRLGPTCWTSSPSALLLRSLALRGSRRLSPACCSAARARWGAFSALLTFNTGTQSLHHQGPCNIYIYIYMGVGVVVMWGGVVIVLLLMSNACTSMMSTRASSMYK